MASQNCRHIFKYLVVDHVLFGASTFVIKVGLNIEQLSPIHSHAYFSLSRSIHILQYGLIPPLCCSTFVSWAFSIASPTVWHSLC